MIRDLMTLQDRVNRLFDEAFPTTRRRTEDQEVFTAGEWTPPIDIYDEPDSIILKADIPGIDPDKLDIRVQDNRLYLKGERTFEKEVNKENFYRVERAYGSFARSFTLPANVEPDKIQATYKNGVLSINLPKREEAKPKQIKINTEEGNKSNQKVNVR